LGDDEKLFVFSLIELFRVGHELEIEEDGSLDARNLNVVRKMGRVHFNRWC